MPFAAEQGPGCGAPYVLRAARHPCEQDLVRACAPARHASSASDADVVWAARVSTAGDKSLEDVGGDAAKSEGLINYLARERHGSPFEHTSMTFFISAPIFVSLIVLIFSLCLTISTVDTLLNSISSLTIVHSKDFFNLVIVFRFKFKF